MAWSTGLYSATIADFLAKTITAGTGLDADDTKVALFGNASKTPDKTVTSANTAYGAGVWNADGVSDASGWPAIGRSLVTIALTNSAGVVKFDADDTVSANDTTTLANVYGCLNYDDTLNAVVNDQGESFHNLSGPQSVTSGRFTVVWNSGGIFTITV